MPALERRRLENRSREEGPGHATNEAVSGPGTPYKMLCAKTRLRQAIFSVCSFFALQPAAERDCHLNRDSPCQVIAHRSPH